MYQIVNRYLNNGYSVIYCVEPNNSPSQVIKNMEQSAQITDLERRIEESTLQVIDRDAFLSHIKKKSSRTNFSRPPISEDQVFQKFKSMFDAARGKINGGSNSTTSRGQKNKETKIVFFGYPTAYYEPDDFELVLVTERALGQFKHYVELPLEIVCCFDSSDIEQMMLWQATSILNFHNKIFHAPESDIDDDDDRWLPSGMLGLIDAGIEKSLGDGSSKLIKSTLRLVYGIDEKVIVENPAKFEEVLRKVIGRGSDEITRGIKNEIVNRLVS